MKPKISRTWSTTCLILPVSKPIPSGLIVGQSRSKNSAPTSVVNYNGNRHSMPTRLPSIFPSTSHPYMPTKSEYAKSSPTYSRTPPNTRRAVVTSPYAYENSANYPTCTPVGGLSVSASPTTASGSPPKTCNASGIALCASTIPTPKAPGWTSVGHQCGQQRQDLQLYLADCGRNHP